MFWRWLLFLSAGLDVVGALLLFAWLDAGRRGALLAEGGLFGLFLASYLLFGWLFGSYTILRWPWLRLRLVMLRLAFTAVSTLAVMVVFDWASNLPETVDFTHRSTLLVLVGTLSLWALAVRLAMRLLVRRIPEQRWQLMADPEEASQIQQEWQRTPFVKPLRLLPKAELAAAECSWRSRSRWFSAMVPPGGVVLGSDLQLAPDQERHLQALGEAGLPMAGVVEMAESQLERLPPSLLPEIWLAMDEIPWANTFSVQRQLKRVADVSLSLLLLVVTAPLLLLLCLLIWLEDRGPVFYFQQRSGFEGRPFRLLKLRTMTCTHPDGLAEGMDAWVQGPSWTMPGDCRITRMGSLLRPARLGELPQLLNVLSGDMSLIGPRPERPELEEELEARISHYRKRHWMRPGLSGWAQVCAPYAASVQEAELKLSYDLYYLRHWSTWLDLLIFAKTIKTVLKGAGR